MQCFRGLQLLAAISQQAAYGNAVIVQWFRPSLLAAMALVPLCGGRLLSMSGGAHVSHISQGPCETRSCWRVGIETTGQSPLTACPIATVGWR